MKKIELIGISFKLGRIKTTSHDLRNEIILSRDKINELVTTVNVLTEREPKVTTNSNNFDGYSLTNVIKPAPVVYKFLSDSNKLSRIDKPDSQEVTIEDLMNLIMKSVDYETDGELLANALLSKFRIERK